MSASHNYVIPQNVTIIFFSAAKSTKERKLSEESEKEVSEASDTESEEEESSNSEADDEDSDFLKEVLQGTEEDISLFKRQLGDLDKAVTNTSDKLNRIQETLDRVMENFRLGKPIDEGTDSKTTNEEVTEEATSESGFVKNVEEIKNSHEIFDRNRLLEVLKSVKIDKLKNPPRLTVGMIGYPNVGKSSSVNVLMQTKKVRISVLCTLLAQFYNPYS